MKQILIAIVVLTICVLSVESASAQPLSRQHRVEVRKHAQVIEKRRHYVKHKAREMRRLERRMIRRHAMAHQMNHRNTCIHRNMY